MRGDVERLTICTAKGAICRRLSRENRAEVLAVFVENQDTPRPRGPNIPACVHFQTIAAAFALRAFERLRIEVSAIRECHSSLSLYKEMFVLIRDWNRRMICRGCLEAGGAALGRAHHFCVTVQRSTWLSTGFRVLRKSKIAPRSSSVMPAYMDQGITVCISPLVVSTGTGLKRSVP